MSSSCNLLNIVYESLAPAGIRWKWLVLFVIRVLTS